MISNYTKNITVDTTGGLILEFDISEVDAFIITPTQDIYFGFNDITQALFPLLANTSFAMSHQDFKNQTQEKILGIMKKYVLGEPSSMLPGNKIIRIYAKGQAVSSVISINFLGGNR